MLELRRFQRLPEHAAQRLINAVERFKVILRRIPSGGIAHRNGQRLRRVKSRQSLFRIGQLRLIEPEKARKRLERSGQDR